MYVQPWVWVCVAMHFFFLYMHAWFQYSWKLQMLLSSLIFHHLVRLKKAQMLPSKKKKKTSKDNICLIGSAFPTYDFSFEITFVFGTSEMDWIGESFFFFF